MFLFTLFLTYFRRIALKFTFGGDLRRNARNVGKLLRGVKSQSPVVLNYYRL